MGRAARERMRALMLVLAMLLAPSVLAQTVPPLPGATAPQLSVFVEEPGGTGMLPGTTVTLTLRVTYNPGQSGRPAPAPSAERPEDTTPTRITIAVKAQPTWVDNVTFDPPVLYANFSASQVQPAHHLVALAYVNISPFAPANEREPFVVTLTAEPNGNIPGQTAESGADFFLRARIVGKLNVTAEPTLVVAGGRWTTVPFAVRNEGNSPIVAKVNVTVRPENSQVEFLDTLQLAHNETKVVDVRMRVPWTNAEFGTLELEAVPIVDGEEGEIARAEIAVRGESAVPLSPWLIVGALLIVSQGTRLRGRRDNAN